MTETEMLDLLNKTLSAYDSTDVDFKFEMLRKTILSRNVTLTDWNNLLDKISLDNEQSYKLREFLINTYIPNIYKHMDTKLNKEELVPYVERLTNAENGIGELNTSVDTLDGVLKEVTKTSCKCRVSYRTLEEMLTALNSISDGVSSEFMIPNFTTISFLPSASCLGLYYTTNNTQVPVTGETVFTYDFDTNRVFDEKLRNIDFTKEVQGDSTAINIQFFSEGTVILIKNTVIVIEEVGVPDMWVVESYATAQPASVTTREEFLTTLRTEGFVQLPHHKITRVESGEKCSYDVEDDTLKIV